MKISDRIRRLEGRDGGPARMSQDEVEAAAAVFSDTLARDGAPLGSTAEKQRAGWRALVAAPSPGWLQRVYAGMLPGDAYL